VSDEETTARARRGLPAPEVRRLSFGAVAETYDRHRPGYPPEALAWLLGEAPLRVADVGSGTGRLAVVEQALGHDVVSIDPDAQMRAVAERSLPGLTAEGTAESLPLPDSSVDAVTIAQAWHWVDAERGLPELARVIRPGGVLGVMWNFRDETGWVADYARLLPDEDTRRTARPAPVLGTRFAPVELRVFHHAMPLAPLDLVGLALSSSTVAANPERDAILAEVGELARTHPELAGRDRVLMPYTLDVYRARRL
jgi:SAM-dependent methyltransferase